MRLALQRQSHWTEGPQPDSRKRRLTNNGCYAKGNSILIPPAFGTIGTSGRNNFRDLGFKDWDCR